MRLIFVEGIMGADKSTTAQRVVEHLERCALRARVVPEGIPELGVGQQLAHHFAPWTDVSIDGYIERCRDSWRAFTAAESDAAVAVCDGLLFHGNMSDPMLMDADALALERHFDRVVEAISAGPAWESYQLTWRLCSPYARASGVVDFDGFARLYQEYQGACDALVGQNALPTQRLEDDRGWPERERAIFDWLGAG